MRCILLFGLWTMVIAPVAAQCPVYYPPPVIYIYPPPPPICRPVYPVGPIYGAPAPAPFVPIGPTATPKAPKTAAATPDKEKIPELPKPRNSDGEPSKSERIPKTDLPVESKKDPAALLAKPFEEYMIPGPARKRAEVPTEVKVGFFNHSGRDMELTVNGEAVKLPKDQYITMKLPRNFNWSEKGGKSREAKIPDDSDGLEIVLRQ